MRLIFKLSWRNLWRNKRRTIISILAVVFAVMLTTAMRGIQLGTYESNIKNAVNLFSGHLQIQKTGYLDNPTLQKSFVFSGELESLLRQESEVVAFAPRVNADGLISFKENSMGALIFGIKPDEERRVTTFSKKLNAGEFHLDDNGDEIVIGHKLLANLKASIGDTVVVLAQGFDGSLGNLKFHIVGTIKSGSPQFDSAAIFMGLSTAQDLLALYGRVNAVAVSIVDLDKVESVSEALNEKLAETDLLAQTWLEIIPDLKQAIELDNISGQIFLWILIVVVAFGILNTLLMSVTERFKEFGVSLAIGMRNTKLVIQVLIESMIIVLIGLAVGNILGIALNTYIVFNPINIGGDWAMMYEEYGFLPRIDSTVDPAIFIRSSLNLVLVSILAALYPAYKVFRLEPLKGIRYT